MKDNKYTPTTEQYLALMEEANGVIATLRVEVEKLTQWKAEATAVIRGWEQCYTVLEKAGYPAVPGDYMFNHVRHWLETTTDGMIIKRRTAESSDPESLRLPYDDATASPGDDDA